MFFRNIPIVKAYQPSTGLYGMSLLMQHNPKANDMISQTFWKILNSIVQSDSWEVATVTFNTIFSICCTYLILKWRRRLDIDQNQRFRNDVPGENEMVPLA